MDLDGQEDSVAHEILDLTEQVRKNSLEESGEDRSAFSSVGDKKEGNGSNEKNDLLVLDYEQLSSMSENNDNLEESKTLQSNKKRKNPTDIVAKEEFPDSDKDDENEGSEGIDEGFLQVASAGSFNTGSNENETRNNMNNSNQDEAAMFSY